LCGLRGSSGPIQSRVVGRFSGDDGPWSTAGSGVDGGRGVSACACLRGGGGFSTSVELAGRVGITVLVLDHLLFGANC